MIRGSLRIGGAIVLALAATASAAEDAYRVGPGDQLMVSTFGQPEMTGPARVRENGEIALHMIGRIDVEGMTLSEVEAAVAERVAESFGGEPSIVVEMERFRDFYVLGDVQTPGAYPYQPGMTVMKALAIAGGMRNGAQPDGAGDQYRIDDARRRATEARLDVESLRDEIAAIDEQLARQAGDGELDAGGEDAADEREPQSPREALTALRAETVRRAVEQAERQARLAEEEARSFEERREIIAQQLKATEEQLQSAQGLIDRGLARRETALDLEIEAGNYRADELEATAFEARARQTAANAGSEARIIEAQHREELLANRIRAVESLARAEAGLRIALEFLRTYGGAHAALDAVGATAPTFEIHQGGTGDASRAAFGDPLAPDDVLVVRLEALTQ